MVMMMGMGMAVWVRADCAAGRAAGLCEGRAGSTLGGGEEVQADRGAAARGGGQTLAGAKQSAVFSSIATYIHTYIHTYTCEQELHEKTLLLHSSENERAGREAGLRSEAAGATQMAATLKAELERRSDTVP